MKDAKGHGSDPRGAHNAGIDAALRPKLADGRLQAQAGDKVYQMVPGFGGMGASINGEVYSSRNGLRVRITGSDSMLGGGGVAGPKTVQYNPRWTVQGDPLPAQRAQAREDASRTRDAEFKASQQKAESDAQGRFTSAVNAGHVPASEANAKVGMIVHDHFADRDQEISELDDKGRAYVRDVGSKDSGGYLPYKYVTVRK
jgi:hypothetical protein